MDLPGVIRTSLRVIPHFARLKYGRATCRRDTSAGFRGDEGLNSVVRGHVRSAIAATRRGTPKYAAMIFV